jgi:cytochrome d ubiquinol oxidase subunit I
VPAGAIGLTLAMYLALYAALIVAYIGVLYRLAGKADTNPEAFVPAGGGATMATPKTQGA